VVGAGHHLLGVPDGTTLVVDGSVGLVIVDPDPVQGAEYRASALAHTVHTKELRQQAAGPATTRDGLHIRVVANIASRSDAISAVRCGADGVGVLRTEFLFLDRPQSPASTNNTRHTPPSHAPSTAGV
jgi:phosphoenolpyruvate-protein kinase (PTS system EI component)